MQDDPIICRCEEIAESEITAAIEEGAADLEGVKRITRAGMGFCQGQSCSSLIAAKIAQKKGISPGEIPPLRKRAPVDPVSLGELAEGASNT